MNAEKLYDAFAQIDDDLLDGAAGTTRIKKDRSAKRMFKTAVAALIVTLIFAAAELTVFAVGASYADMTLGEYFGKVFRKEINVDISGAVAVVNGEPIYKSSLDFLMQSSPNVDEKTALEELIKQVLLTQEAEKRCYGLRITDEDVKKTVETQMRYLKQIAALPESEQTESVRQLLSYLSENGITIEEYYLNEESFRTYRNMLMRSALLGDITKGETDPDKIIEKTESFKNELYEKAEIEILLAEEPPYVIGGVSDGALNGGTVLWITGAVLLCYLVSLAAVIIKAKKPALAPASGETAAECYPAFAPRRGTFKPRALAAVMIALLVVGAGVAFYLIRDGRANKPGIDGVIQSDYPREGSAVDGENSEINRPDEPVSNYFGSYDLEGFLGFIKNGGKTPAHTGGHLWSEYAENAEFIEWVDGKAQIPVPVTASGFKVTYSCVGEKEYSFYISGDSGEKLTVQLTVCEIPSGETSDLSEIVRRYMAESGKAFYDADGEHISGECKFGEYVLYDRHPWKLEFQGEETTSICPPVLFFRYGDYLVRVIDRRNPEAGKWDIHFLDCFDLEMYEIQE